jgi:hypothetical protein
LRVEERSGKQSNRACKKASLGLRQPDLYPGAVGSSEKRLEAVRRAASFGSGRIMLRLSHHDECEVSDIRRQKTALVGFEDSANAKSLYLEF